MAKKSIEFTANNVKAFTAWLKRFSLIDNSLLLEIDQAHSKFTAKTYNEERSVVKRSSINFDDAGLTTQPDKDSKRIKVGIFNIPRLIKTIEQYGNEEFTLNIDYQEIINENDTQYAAEKILLKNKNLKMNLDCTSLNIFKYISDELFNGTIASLDPILGNFSLNQSVINKIVTLNNLDSEYKFMLFEFKDKQVYVSGKSYNLLIDDASADSNNVMTIFKDQYDAIDIEDYKVSMGEDRLVFISENSETVTVISKAEDKD